MSDHLMELYRDAVFEVEAEAGRLRLRLDAMNAELDALLSRHHVTGTWAFITAYNPGEERPSAEENQRAQKSLEEQVRHAGLRMWSGDGASPDRVHVEPSIFIGGIDPASARALGRAFRQRAIVVGAVGEPARLLDLSLVADEPRGLPVPHRSGRPLFVTELHVSRLFAGWLEGGPDGERVRQDIFAAAAAACGLPVHVRMPASLPREANRKFVVENAPRALCVARVHSSVQDDDAAPSAWSVAWPSRVVGDAALEELCQMGLFDAPLVSDAPAFFEESELRPSDASPVASQRGAFHDMVLRSQDGWDLEVDSLHLGFIPGVLDGAAAGDISSAESSRRQRWEVATVVYVSASTGMVSAAPARVDVPEGAAVVRVSLVADPVHHSTTDADGYWRSRVMLFAVIEPGARPLRQTIETSVGLLPWKAWATDADEMP